MYLVDTGVLLRYDLKLGKQQYNEIINWHMRLNMIHVLIKKNKRA